MKKKLTDGNIVQLISYLSSEQLEKTRNDLQSDLLDMEWRLDHEGKEFHHFDDFCQLYRAEILNLNRTLVSSFCYNIIFRYISPNCCVFSEHFSWFQRLMLRYQPRFPDDPLRGNNLRGLIARKGLSDSIKASRQLELT